MDLLADYREAQANGHHPDCDGYRTAHRVTYTEAPRGCFAAVCADCGPLHAGMFGQAVDVRRLFGDHSREVRCDGQCKAWT